MNDTSCPSPLPHWFVSALLWQIVWSVEEVAGCGSVYLEHTCIFFLEQYRTGYFLLTSQTWQFLSFFFPHCIYLPSPSHRYSQAENKTAFMLIPKGFSLLHFTQIQIDPVSFFQLQNHLYIKQNDLNNLRSKIYNLSLFSTTWLVVFLVCHNNESI